MSSFLLLSLALIISTPDGDTDLSSLFPPAPEMSLSLTLQDMLAQAEERSFVIQQAIANEMSAQASRDRGLSALLPDISASLAYNAGRQIIPENSASHKFSGTAQIWLSLIDVGSWLDFKVAKGRYSAQQSRTELVRQQVAYQLAVAYLQAVSMRTLLDLLRSEAGAIVAQKQIAAWRIGAGVGSASEELQAQMELLALRKEYAAARLSYLRQCETLGELLGYDGPVAPVVEKLFLKEVPNGEAPEHLELSIARQSMELAQKAVKSSQLNWVPALTSTWQMGANWPIKPEDVNTLSLGAVLNLSIPLFDWNLAANIRENKAALLAAKIAYEEQEQKLAREERLAREEVRQLEAELSLYKEQAQLAEATLTLDMGEYQNGSGSVLQVIQSRRSHQVAQVEELRERYALDIARLAYWQAKGYLLEQIIQGSL